MNTTFITNVPTGIGRAASPSLLIIAMLLIAFSQATRAQQSTYAAQASQKSCQQILVMGAVQRPARLDAQSGLRLLDALAMAGGPGKRVGKTIRVVHSCDKPGTQLGGADEYNLIDVLRGRENGNPYVGPGDIVVVSSADLVAVIGNVRKTEVVFTEIAFVDGMTMMRAIKLAGGVRQRSDLVMVRIHRSANGVLTRDSITVSLKAIKERRIEDVALQPWDIIEVSDELGHFHIPRRSNPIWDPPLLPRKDSSSS